MDFNEELELILDAMGYEQWVHLSIEIEDGHIHPGEYWSYYLGCGCIYGNAVWDSESNNLPSKALGLLQSIVYSGQSAVEDLLAAQVAHGDTPETSSLLAYIHNRVMLRIDAADATVKG